jgi:AAA domain
MLTLARALAGPAGKFACIDTEHGSLSKYAHSPYCTPHCSDPSHFVFDVDEPNSDTTDYLLDQLAYAEQNGYAVFCVDSLSHFWMAKDGALEFVDNAKKRTRDQMDAWKMFRAP